MGKYPRKCVAQNPQVQRPYMTRSSTGSLKTIKSSRSATRNVELEKQLKRKYGIKEVSVVLFDHLYDNSIPLHLRCFLKKKNEELSCNWSKKQKCSLTLEDDNSSSLASTAIMSDDSKENENFSCWKNHCKSMENAMLANSRKEGETGSLGNMQNNMVHKYNIEKQEKNDGEMSKDGKKEKSMPIIDDGIAEERNMYSISMQEYGLSDFKIVVRKSDAGDNYYIEQENEINHNVNNEVFGDLKDPQNAEKTLQAENSSRKDDGRTFEYHYSNNPSLTDMLSLLQEEKTVEKDQNVNNNYIDTRKVKKSEMSSNPRVEDESCSNIYEWIDKYAVESREHKKAESYQVPSLVFPNSGTLDDTIIVLNDLLGLEADKSSRTQPVNILPEKEIAAPKTTSTTLAHEITEDIHSNIKTSETQQSGMTPKKNVPKIIEDSILPKGTLNLSGIRHTSITDIGDCNGSISPFSSLPLTVNNLRRFNELTRNQKSTNNINITWSQSDEVQHADDMSNRNSKENAVTTQSLCAQRKRKWMDNTLHRIATQSEEKKIKFNEPRDEKNTGTVGFDKFNCSKASSSCSLASKKNSEGEPEFGTTVNNCNAEDGDLLKGNEEPNSVKTDIVNNLESFSQKRSSVASADAELNGESKTEKFDCEHNTCENLSTDFTLRDCSLTHTSPTGTHENDAEVGDIGKDNTSMSTNVVAAKDLSPVQSTLLNEEQDDGDVIKLYVDEGDRLSFTDTELEDQTPVKAKDNKSKIVKSKPAGNHSARKNAENKTVRADYRIDKEYPYNFDFNLYVKNNQIECKKTFESIEVDNASHNNNVSQSLHASRMDKNANVKRGNANDTDEKEIVNDDYKKKIMPLMAMKLAAPVRQMIHFNYTSRDSLLQSSQVEGIEPALNKENNETELNDEIIRKMCIGFCFRLLKRGNCLNMVNCRFRHDMTVLYQQIRFKTYSEILAIFKYLLKQQYFYIAKCVYADAIERLSDDKEIVNLFGEMLKGGITNPQMIHTTVNALLKIQTDLKNIIHYLIDSVPTHDEHMVTTILNVVETYIPIGQYWNTLRSLFLKLTPRDRNVNKILLECITMEKDSKHLEDVNKFLVVRYRSVVQSAVDDTMISSFFNLLKRKKGEIVKRRVSPVRENYQITSPSKEIATIISPDVPTDNEQIGKLPRNVNHHSATKNNVETIEKGPTDGNSFVVHPIENVPEPSSVYRNRNWKFYVDLYRMKEGLKHFDYDYVIEILETYANADQHTLFARSLYNILRAEIKRSHYHLSNIIERTVPLGSPTLLQTVIQAGRYVLSTLVNEELWVLASTLRKSLQPYNLSFDAEYVLLSAEIYIAKRESLKAFTLLKHNNIIYSNRNKWLIPNNENDLNLRIMILDLLLESLARDSTVHALFLFEFLVRDQSRNCTPIDLSRYTDLLMKQFLINDCVDEVQKMATVLMKHNFTLSRLVFRALISYLYKNNIFLGKQVYQYGIGLGMYSDVTLSNPVFVILNVHWTEGEQYYHFSELFEKLAMDIGLAIGQLKVNQLRIYVIFEKCPADYSLSNMDDSQYTNKLQRESRETLKNVLKKRFKPSMKLVKKYVGKVYKLASGSVMDYLKKNYQK